MSFFGNVQEDTTASPLEDRVGGFQPLPSGVYKGKVEVAYGLKSSRGAMGVRIECNLNVDGKPRKYTQTYWVTNAKGETTYTDKNGQKHNLAGFNHINAICHMLAGKSLNQLVTEDRSIKVGDKLEIVPVITELLDKELALGILHIRQNKQVKSGDTYVPSEDEQFINEVDYVFNANGLTYIEVRNGKTEPEFIFKWKEANEGKVKDKYKEVKKATSATSSGANIDFS